MKSIILFVVLVLGVMSVSVGQSVPPWPYINTGASHTIVVRTSVNPRVFGVPLTNGDAIGVFYTLNNTQVCGGYEIWTGGNISVAAWGDDPGTPLKDGFASGEVFRWKVWRHTDGQVFPANPAYLPAGSLGGIVTHDSVYAHNGISALDTLGVLPVQLGSFTGRVIAGGRVRLDWMTLSETNNYGFEVQKSTHPTSGFLLIPGSFIPGHGTTLEPHHYTFTDIAPAGNLPYYRLRQLDLDGTVHYTDAIRIDGITSVEQHVTPVKYVVTRNYPNPFNPSTTIEFSLPEASWVSLKIFDVMGSEVTTLVNGHRRAGNFKAEWDAKGFASGVYLYRLQVGDFISTKKLILLR